MNRWLGVGKDYLERYSKRTDNVVFLHIKRTKKLVEEKQEAPAEKVWSNWCQKHYFLKPYIFYQRGSCCMFLKGVTTGD